MFQQMEEMKHDYAIIFNSQVPPNKGTIQKPSGSFEQAHFMKISTQFPAKEIKVEYRKDSNSFLIFKTSTLDQIQEFIAWCKINIKSLTPEHFGNHYTDLAVAAGCGSGFGCEWLSIIH